MDLKSWFIQYMKYRLAFGEKETNIIDDDNAVIINGDKYEIQETLNKITQNSIVCLNKRENVEFLVENWDKFSDNKNQKIYFVNTKTNDKWVISPYLHSKLTSPKTLKKGILTLFESTPEM